MSDNRTSGMVLLVDDDELTCEVQKQRLESAGHKVRVYHDGESCIAALSEVLPDVVCLDLEMPGIGGFKTLELIKEHHPFLPVIVITSSRGAEPAVRAMRLGAYNYLVKPVDQVRLLTEVGNTIERHRISTRLAQLERERAGTSYPGMVGDSPAMRALYGRLDRIAANDITVLVCGESGTGKELVATALHRQSTRGDKPFIALNCAAITESLQESELFGHEKGAFTGAAARRPGCFERAHGGTLFLDEIGELSPSLQAKLLRVLQERTFQRVGGTQDIKSDFRLVAATNRDLNGDVEAGRFRSDLYYRIAVMEVAVPPLRERTGDVVLLVHHFARAMAREGKTTPPFAATAIAALESYPWPGNVRELQNAVESAVIESNGKEITLADLPARIRETAPSDPAADRESITQHTGIGTGHSDSVPVRTLDEMEREAILASMARNQGNVARVVEELGIGRTTLYRKIKKYDLGESQNGWGAQHSRGTSSNSGSSPPSPEP